ncbi:reticulophagy regulator 2 [Eleutherodactylus coqui]|uniref:RETREG1-3/ARL6IP-like N-terminal reticulon-homology domain-containing protein n=1 Tax=Eleutherodactylus coqui TaxID=57060 RepID=A0A8J6EH00_ELECQ|nr:hypothetical protein GDO78_021927 [Eleutherodactylus coqui]
MSCAAEPSAPGAKKMAREEVTSWPAGDPSQGDDRSGRESGASEEDMKSLQDSLHQHLSEWGPLLTAGQRLLVWERPLPSLLTAAALHGAFWLFSYLSLRPVFLISFVLLCLLGVDRWKPWLLRRCRVQPRGDPSADSDPAVGATGHHRLLSLPELCHCLAETWFTSQQYIQELLLYKRQNPGKFCAMVCSCCAALAVVGHYVPGIMISYIILLSVLLWPLVVYRELIQKMYTALEPVLMKLDYSMKGEDMPRSHKKRQIKKEPEEGQEVMTADTDSESEIELSGFSPQLDVRITALALSITDSELSDEEASILESGGFSVSRATTPQLTDVSEDLDQPGATSEEPPPADSPESPLWLRHRGEDEKPSPPSKMPLLPAEPLTLSPEELLPTLTSPLHFVNTHFNGKGQPPQQEGEIHPLREETADSAVTTAPLANLELPPPETVEPAGDVEDFELLEQGELDLMRKELEEVEKELSSSKSHEPGPDS